MQKRLQRAILFLHGDISDIPRIRVLIQPDDLIICADGGVKYAQQLGIMPHIILGDFDSLPPSARACYKDKPVEWISHPPKKNQYETDSELAIRVAKKRGVAECLIFGFCGIRLDHMTANLFLFARYATSMRITIIEPNQRLTFVTKTHEWEGKPGDLVSLVALSQRVTGVTTQGLQYPLTDAILKQGTTVGVSNVMTTPRVSVKIRSGVLLVIVIPSVA